MRCARIALADRELGRTPNPFNAGDKVELSLEDLLIKKE